MSNLKIPPSRRIAVRCDVEKMRAGIKEGSLGTPNALSRALELIRSVPRLDRACDAPYAVPLIRFEHGARWLIVRFAPESRHQVTRQACPLRAESGQTGRRLAKSA